ncbi:hypothetical protein NHX12_025971, partial [Muraenolepis orangiensis]
MKRSEKPEGHRQMRPKTFPVSNYSGNSQQMLQEIRESLRNLPRPSDPAKVDVGSSSGKMLPEDPRQPGRSPRNPYHKALQEIRKSLMPFANEPVNAGRTSEVNKRMLQDLVSAGFEEEMCIRALKQTNSRSMEAALEYISKMSYQEPVGEQMAAAAARPLNAGVKAPGPSHIQQPVVRRPSWKGSKESLTQRHSVGLEVMTYRSDSPGPQAELSARGPPPAFPQGHPGNGQRVNPHLPPQVRSVTPPPNRGATPPPPNWDSNPSNKLYPGNMDYPRMSPVPQGAWTPDGYSTPAPQNQRGISPVPVGRQPIIMQSLATTKFTFPSGWSQNSSPQPDYMAGGSRQPPPPYAQNMPTRSNSFNSRAGSQPSATTVTAITQAPILQPVKSMRVQKPELHTANPVVAEVPSYQGPPPPYPKHLLQQPAGPSPPSFESGGASKPAAGREESPDTELVDGDKASEGGPESKEPKQITTSPVPVRRGSKKDEEPRSESSRLPLYSPQAFKFFMEQHVENVLKNHQQRIRRRKQLESEMQRVSLSQDAQEQMRMMLCQKESNYIRLKRAKMDKSMFQRIKTLGVGAFGEVCLARKEDAGTLYAIKTLRKRDVLQRNQVAHVKAERDILAEADNEWVVRLYYSFQDRDHLYFVMDYIPGGDMMSLLIRLGVFREELAQFYVAELTCAVESVHRMGFIHRDIKPDNILIDRDGHIKLTDFGLCTGFRWTHDSKYYQSGDHVRQDSMDFSKDWEDPANCRCSDRLKPLERRKARQHQRCLAHSLVGTPNYIAPEVLLRYTQLCDWWSVGVILYEMVVGQPPFLATTPLETQLKVINWQSALHIPAQAKLSAEASDLIVQLCRGPEDRLGKDGADQIKGHSFLATVDFSSDLRQQRAPYVPTIAHCTDTSNFDPVDPDKLWSEEGDGGGGDGDHNDDTLAGWFRNGKHPEHAFYEFTFRRFFDDNGHPYSCPKPIDGQGLEGEGEDYEENSDADGEEAPLGEGEQEGGGGGGPGLVRPKDQTAQNEHTLHRKNLDWGA